MLSDPAQFAVRFFEYSENQDLRNARIGVAWFIQDPDSTGNLNAMALVRNFIVEDGFAVFRMVANTVTGVWTGPGGDGFDDGGWTWVRIQHQIDTSEGNVRYRVWQGDLADEPTTWASGGHEYLVRARWRAARAGNHGGCRPLHERRCDNGWR